MALSPGVMAQTEVGWLRLGGSRVAMAAAAATALAFFSLMSNSAGANSPTPSPTANGSTSSAIRVAARIVDGILERLDRRGVLHDCIATGRGCEEGREYLVDRLVELRSLRRAISAEAARHRREVRILEAYLAFVDRLDRFVRDMRARQPTSGDLRDLLTAAMSTLHTAPRRSPITGGAVFRTGEYRSAPEVRVDELSDQPSGASTRTSPASSTEVLPGYLGETPEIRFTAEVDAIINAYHGDVLSVFEFVRDAVRYQPYYGSMKDSQNVLASLAANDVDQTSLLLALLRRMAVPSRYVLGTVEVPIGRAQSWLGVQNPQTVGDILATAFVPVTLVREADGSIVAVRFEHVWVEALLGFANYRGIPNRADGPAWVPLDPSLQDLADNGGPNLALDSQFDADAFLREFLTTLRSNSPGERYLSDLQGFVRNRFPGRNFYEVLWEASSVPEDLRVAPASLPYSVVNVAASFSTIPEQLQNKIHFSANGLSYSASVTSLVGRRVTLIYEPATQADRDLIALYGNIYEVPADLIDVRPELRVDGAPIAMGAAIGLGEHDLFSLSFLSGGAARGSVINRLVAAGRYALGLAAPDAAAPVVLESAAALAEAARRVGEPTFDPDDTLGEMLFMHSMAYLHRLVLLENLIARSMKLSLVHSMGEAIVGTDAIVTVSGGVPVDVDPGGVYIDVDRYLVNPFPVDGSTLTPRSFMVLLGSTGSALEHIVFEQDLGVDSVSTIKILQLAAESGIPVYEIDSSNVAGTLPLLTHPEEIVDLVFSEVFNGRRVTIPRDPVVRNSWTGAGLISMDVATGGAAYFIAGGVSGGSITELPPFITNITETGAIEPSEAERIGEGAREGIRLPFPGPNGSPYGKRFDPFTGEVSFHQGKDFPVEVGTAVPSVGGGRVARSYSSETFGETVIVNHGKDANGDTVYTLYAHLQSGTRIAQGSPVDSNSTIGLSDDTGRSTGPHLHYEVRVIPPGGPDPFSQAFFNGSYSRNPSQFVWPSLPLLP